MELLADKDDDNEHCDGSSSEESMIFAFEELHAETQYSVCSEFSYHWLDSFQNETDGKPFFIPSILVLLISIGFMKMSMFFFNDRETSSLLFLFIAEHSRRFIEHTDEYAAGNTFEMRSDAEDDDSKTRSSDQDSYQYDGDNEMSDDEL